MAHYGQGGPTAPVLKGNENLALTLYAFRKWNSKKNYMAQKNGW